MSVNETLNVNIRKVHSICLKACSGTFNRAYLYKIDSRGTYFSVAYIHRVQASNAAIFLYNLLLVCVLYNCILNCEIFYHF